MENKRVQFHAVKHDILQGIERIIREHHAEMTFRSLPLHMQDNVAITQYAGG